MGTLKRLLWTQPLAAFELNGNTSRVKSILIIFIIPFILTFLFVWLVPRSQDSNDTYGTNVLTAASILVGFMINMLVPLFNIIEKEVPPARDPVSAMQKNRLKEYRIMYYRIAMAISVLLIGIALLLFLTTFSAMPAINITDEINLSTHLVNGYRFITYYCFCVAALNIYLILVSANALIHSGLNSTLK